MATTKEASIERKLIEQILETCKAINVRAEREDPNRLLTQPITFPGAHTLIILAREGHC